MWRPQKKDILFVAGLIGLGLEETRLFGDPSEILVFAFLALMGVPLMLRADEAREKSHSSTREPPNGPSSLDGSEIRDET